MLLMRVRPPSKSRPRAVLFDAGVCDDLIRGCSELFATKSHREEIVKTTVCEVPANPTARTHKLIELTGYASEGMENFSLSAKDCQTDENNWTSIWLEYGARCRSPAGSLRRDARQGWRQRQSEVRRSMTTRNSLPTPTVLNDWWQ